MYVVPGRYLVDMCHPLLLLCGGGGVNGKGLAPGADQPAVLELSLVIQGLQLHLQIIR